MVLPRGIPYTLKISNRAGEYEPQMPPLSRVLESFDNFPKKKEKEKKTGKKLCVPSCCKFSSSHGHFIKAYIMISDNGLWGEG